MTTIPTPLMELVNQYGKAAHEYGLGDHAASDDMTDLWREITRRVAETDAELESARQELGRLRARDNGSNARRCEDPACRNYGTSLHPTPVVLAVDPGVQVEQEATA